MDRIPTQFSVEVFGKFEQYNQVISKARCRIFYKGENRNGTYITDEFANKLISTLPYTPIKGIYNDFNEDYEDHGENRDEGRIYGIVPENPNFAWEENKDEDGVTRTYACADILIFSALYKEANEIVGKAQSMEIYTPSIKGQWRIIGGKRLYEYTDGCFLGLQVLGEDVEPCFEGAAFFSFYDSLKSLLDQMEKYNLNFQKTNEGGQNNMVINFKLSDAQKENKLFVALNPNFNEAGEWVCDYGIYDVYDNYAVVRNYAEQKFERVYFTKDDENDTLTIDKKEDCFIVDVTSDEKKALQTIQALNNGNYEKIDETFSAANQKVEELNGQVENLTEEKTNFEQKIGELNESISTLNTEKEKVEGELSTANDTITSLNEEVDSLKTFKLETEKVQKEGLINTYAGKLSQETLDEFAAKIAEYTYTDLDKDLAYALVKQSPAIFSKQPENQYIPKDNDNLTGLEAILAKYKK